MPSWLPSVAAVAAGLGHRLADVRSNAPAEERVRQGEGQGSRRVTDRRRSELNEHSKRPRLPKLERVKALLSSLDRDKLKDFWDSMNAEIDRRGWRCAICGRVHWQAHDRCGEPTANRQEMKTNEQAANESESV